MEINYVEQKTICLNMIVKDESPIIEKTLENILSKIDIDYWVISDTGSSDNTREIITDFFLKRNIKGELHEDAWQGFGPNRTIALQHAYGKTDYVFMFDADDKIVGDLNINKLTLNCDQYDFKMGKSYTFMRPMLFNNHKKWKYIGVLHEYLSCLEPPITKTTFAGDYYINACTLGNRSLDPDKYKKDAELLTNAYETEPEISLKERYAFYAAQSFRDSSQTDKSIEWYKLVLTLNNWAQEKYYSCLMLGKLYKSLNDFETAIKYFTLSYTYDKERIEGIVYACNMFYEKGQHMLVNAMYERYKHITHESCDFSKKLFITSSCYNDELSYYNSVSSYYLQSFSSGYESCKRNIINGVIDKGRLYNALHNMAFYIGELKKDDDFLKLFSNVNKMMKDKCIEGDVVDAPSLVGDILYDKEKCVKRNIIDSEVMVWTALFEKYNKWLVDHTMQ